MNFIDDSSPLDSPHKDERVDGSVNDHRNTSSDTDSFDEPVSDHGFDDWQTVSGDSIVECLPDYIVYGDKYSTDSVVTFSSSCIKIEGSWQADSFEFQWGVDHILNIECQWCERLELATVTIIVNSKGTTPTRDIHDHTGIEEFKFAIVEDWYRKQNEILSLDVYKPLWNIVLSSDMEKDAKVLTGQSKIFPSKYYFPSFEDSFEDVIYPKGDPDAVSISKRDVDRLQPDTFVNDTIIDFYVKYLKNKIDPSEKHKFHFFNSFFYPKLAEFGKSPSSSLEGSAAFRSVRRWTRKISLFEKDYIFVPVNFNYHWSLIVICHPGEVADFQDSDARKSLKLPCILHMDSIRGSHSGLKGLIQSYLWEEWKERHTDTSEDISPNFSNMRFFSLELPQQQNLYDCGLFLLHYVELFLEGNLFNFNPLKLSRFSNFLTANWFEPAEASLKRAYIQRLVFDILDDGSCESSPTAGDNENCTSMYHKSVDENGTTSEPLLDRSSFSKVFHESAPCSIARQGLELTLLQTSFAESIEHVNDSGFISRGPAKAEAVVESFCQAFEQTAPSEEFKNASESIQPVNGTGFVSRGHAEAEAAVESLCQAFEQTPLSEEFKNVSESIQPVTDSAFVSRRPALTEAALESFCQAFEQTAPSEEFENASESIQPVYDTGYVSRGPAVAEAALESLCQSFEQRSPSEESNNASDSIQPVNGTGFVSRGPAEAEAAESNNASDSIQPVNGTGFVSRGPAEAEAAVESFCQAFEQTHPSEEFENASESIQPVNDTGFVSRGPAEAEAAVESFEQTAPSEEFKNTSESIQPVNGSGFVSRGPAEAEAAIESFCQAFEQTPPSEEFENAFESIQSVNDTGFVSRGPAEVEAAVESICQASEQTTPYEEFKNAMPPIKEEGSYKHFCCSSLGTARLQEPTTMTSEASGAYLSSESGKEPLWNRGSDICQNVHMHIGSFKESICASNGLSKSEDVNHSKIGTNLSMEVKLDDHKPKFLSQDNLELFVDLRVHSFSDNMLDGNNAHSKNHGSPSQNCDALEDRSAACEPMQSKFDGSDTCLQQATKKRRLAPMDEGLSLDEDLHE